MSRINVKKMIKTERNIFYNTRKSVKEKGLPALYNSVTYSIPSKLTKPPASRMD